MKRSVVSVFACSLCFAVVGTVHADELQSTPDVQHADGYEAVRAVLFIPDAPIPLVPGAECPQGTSDNAGLGCVASLEMATDYEPPANIDDVIAGVTTALEPYNVLVTTVRPPEYVPYQLLMPGDAVNEESLSRTCTSAPIDCDGVRRNDLAFTNGGSMFCMMPDPVQAALIAFGYMSGLENTDNANDVMYYQSAAPFGPDYTMPIVAFDDACGELVQTVDDMEMVNPLGCSATVNHEPFCDNMDNQANSHQELLGYYGPGPFVEDTTPPVIESHTLPDDGTNVDGDLDLSVVVSDDQGLVFVRMTIQSTALIGLDPRVDETGTICKSHNQVCAIDIEETPPYHQNADNTYNANDFAQAPGGEYTVTIEVSDLVGNTAESVTRTFTKDGGMSADTTDGMTTMTSGMTTNSSDPTDSDGDESSSETGDSDDTNDTGQDDDGGGCSCSTEPGMGGAAALLIGMFGFAATRRRRD